MAAINKDEENYLRAVLLLLKGCRYIALEVLCRAARHEKEESGKDIDTVLHEARDKLKKKFDRKQREKLFPNDGSKTQTDNWDISLITGVLLKCYASSLTPSEHEAVKNIRTKRNEVLGHSSYARLPKEDYDDVHSELENSMKILSNKFNESVQKTCRERVQQSLNCKLQTAKEDVKTVYDCDNLCQVLLKKIEELEEQNRELRSNVEQLIGKRRHLEFRTVQVVDTELEISAPESERHAVEMAEQILTTVIDEAIKRVGSDAPVNEIRIVVDEILKAIEQHGMKVVSVEQKCILLRVECTSYNQILLLLEFSDEAKFQCLLKKLADALTKHLGLSHLLELAYRISKESINGMLAYLRDENAQSKTKISLPVQYKSVAGLAHLWSFIEDEKGAGRVEELSKAVSKHLGKDVSIKLSVNPEHVLKALQDPDITALANGEFGRPLSESVYLASAEVIYDCSLCLGVQKGTQASKYCLHCHKNFCDDCLKKHEEMEGKVKPLGHIDMAQSGRATGSTNIKLTDKSTQKCESCKKENVEYFCQQHDILACGSCLQQNHKTCFIDWIQSKAVGVAESKELGDINDKMSDQIESTCTEEIDTIASIINENNEEGLNQVKNEVEVYYQQVLQCIEHMKNETIRDAENAQRMRSKRFCELNDKITEFYNKLVELRENIKLNVKKGKEADVFVLMKKAQSNLRSLKSLTREKDNVLQRSNYVFEPNKKVEEWLLSHSTLGKITEKGYTLENLPRSQNRKKMKVKTRRDERKCSITGCAIMDENLSRSLSEKKTKVKTETDEWKCSVTDCTLIRLLLADANNRKLKILDKRKENVVEELSLNESSCFDVAVLPDNQAAVTQPEKENIVFVKLRGRMEVVKNIKIHKKCFGITYGEKLQHIYTVCCNPCCIVSIDLNGNILQESTLTGTEEVHFEMPQYISVDSENRLFFVTENSFVARVTLNGHLDKVCKIEDFTDLSGISVFEDNTILVCCRKSRCVHRITADMEYVEMFRTGIPDAQTVCFLKNTRQIFLGSSDSYVARIIEMH